MDEDDEDSWDDAMWNKKRQQKEQIGHEWLRNNILIYLTKREVHIATHEDKVQDDDNVFVFQLHNDVRSFHVIESNDHFQAKIQIRKNRKVYEYSIFRKQDLSNVLDKRVLAGRSIPADGPVDTINFGSLTNEIVSCLGVNNKKPMDYDTIGREGLQFSVDGCQYNFKAFVSNGVNPAKIEVFRGSDQVDTFYIHSDSFIGYLFKQILSIMRYPAEDDESVEDPAAPAPAAAMSVDDKLDWIIRFLTNQGSSRGA